MTLACAPPTVTPTRVVLGAVVAAAVPMQPDVPRRAAVASIDVNQAVVIAGALAADSTSCRAHPARTEGGDGEECCLSRAAEGRASVDGAGQLLGSQLELCEPAHDLASI